MSVPETFLWHDYETFGASPMVDRPAQFAAQRTDLELREVGEPEMVYCAPADDVLPHPQACLITGITPQEALEKGLSETEFAGHVQRLMMQPATCSAGFNSLRFDDLVTRTLLYRNLRDPYEREYKNDNSRWDIIDLARMCYALRPAGINWPMVDISGVDITGPDRELSGQQRASFRLQDLSAANSIAHQGAHDALADVRATIALARLLREAQPRLFDWALTMRRYTHVFPLLDPTTPKAILHTSSRIPAIRGCTTMVLPLALSPVNPKSVIVFDLMGDPQPLLHEPADVIHDLVFTPAADLPEGVARLPLKQIRANGVPMLAPVGTLKDADPARIGLDPDRCRRHEQLLLAELQSVRRKVTEVFSQAFVSETEDPDLMLYSGGFFSSGDRHLMNKIIRMDGSGLGGHLWSFQDARLPVMLLRYRARNFPDSLSARERETWQRYRHQRLITPADDRQLSFSAFKMALGEARAAHAGKARAQEILDKLESWSAHIGLPELENTDFADE